MAYWLLIYIPIPNGGSVHFAMQMFARGYISWWYPLYNLYRSLSAHYMPIEIVGFTFKLLYSYCHYMIPISSYWSCFLSYLCSITGRVNFRLSVYSGYQIAGCIYGSCHIMINIDWCYYSMQFTLPMPSSNPQQLTTWYANMWSFDSHP